MATATTTTTTVTTATIITGSQARANPQRKKPAKGARKPAPAAAAPKAIKPAAGKASMSSAVATRSALKNGSVPGSGGPKTPRAKQTSGKTAGNTAPRRRKAGSSMQMTGGMFMNMMAATS